jgi:MFS family permease
VFGGLVAAAALALTLLYREPPPAAARPGGGAPTSGDPPAAESWTLRQALGSDRLWAAFVMMVLGTIGFQIMATHQVAHALDRGFAPATVVWVFAFGAGSQMLGNLAGGWLSDRVGRGGVFALGSLIAIAGIACLAAVRGPDDLFLLGCYTAAGIGFGMRIAQLSAIPADVFAGPSLGAILGVVQAGGGVGGAVGPFLGGWIFDVTGSYQLAFLAAAIAIAGAAVAAWLAARPVTGARSR